MIDTQTRSPHSPQEIQAIDSFNEKLQAHGQRIFAGGLDSPATATVVDDRGGKNQFIDGPFIEFLEPGISLVTQDISAMAAIAANLLFDRIKGKKSKAEIHEVPTIFTPRGSGEL